ncbi:hypothetical protein EV2_019664 [Malus domestica]
MQKWDKPRVGWFKCNFDGAWDELGEVGGVVMVVRDDNGAFVVAIALSFRGVSCSGSDFGCAGSCSFCSEPRSTAGGDEKRHTDGYQGIVEGHGSTWEWSVWQYFTGCKAYVRVL